MSEKRTVIGRFVHTTWTNLNIRCGNGKYQHLGTRSKCVYYDNIKIIFNRDEFKNWCYQNKNLIESLKRPSLDRINSLKDYSLDNIQVIELKDNINKDKVMHVNENGATCYVCGNHYPLDQLAKDNRTPYGRSGICKFCDSRRRKRK